MNNRCEIRHIQEKANPGKYVGCNELYVSLCLKVRKKGYPRYGKSVT